MMFAAAATMLRHVDYAMPMPPRDDASATRFREEHIVTPLRLR